jgi:predicted amidophosphoribosyltransferase
MIAQGMKGQGVAVKEMIECPKCHAQVPADARFCNACGAPVATAATCPGCKADVKPGAKFCASCGRKIDG